MHDVPLITTIAAAFAAAWVLGIITQRLKLSPIVGYLLAGIAIGPHTPGFVGDAKLAGQLAEIGVMLLMFGVGLHFKLSDLLAVRRIAVPGAIGQSIITTLLGVGMALAFGWPLKSGLVLGLAMSVASTVVLLRVLADNDLLETPHGHVAVGWLIVEDIFTVVVLVLIPALGANQHADAGGGSLWTSLLIAMLKLVALVAILLLAGSKVVPWIMVKVARLRSRELFTLTVLVMAVTVAAGSQYIFGASMALGAFLAGMVVGQSPVSNQAAADVLPLRDAFAVLFFTSVGMLFDPAFILHQPLLVMACLSIVLVGKPLAALGIVALIGYPARTGIIVALGLAQIGEFSFILSELGRKHGLVGDTGHHVLVACALVSITINPILLRSVNHFERALERWPAVWRFLNRTIVRRERELNESATAQLEKSDAPLAVILGYGPVGRAVDEIIRKSGLETVVIDLNMDTIQSLMRLGRLAIYGDAYNIEVMAQALPRAAYLVITLPHSANRTPLIAAAKLINPGTKVIVRARYISERAELLQVGADAVCYEEAEAAVGLARLMLIEQGADSRILDSEMQRIRQEFTVCQQSGQTVENLIRRSTNVWRAAICVVGYRRVRPLLVNGAQQEINQLWAMPAHTNRKVAMTTESQTTAGSNKLIWTGRVLSALPVLLMVLGAVYSFAKPEDAQEGFKKYGYPAEVFRPIIIVEMACVVLYVIPQTAVLGAILLTGYLGGATATHVRVSEPFFMPIVVGVVVWLGLVLRDARLRNLIPLRRL